MHGSVVSIRRFPVKSMQGEDLSVVDVGPQGLSADRRFALIDAETGKVASGKDPRRWTAMLSFRASFDDDTAECDIHIGQDVFSSTDPQVNAHLSSALGRQVRIARTVPEEASYDDVWPAIDGLAPQSMIDDSRTGTTDEGLVVSSMPVGLLAPGTFQDVAPVTLLTTSSLRRLQELLPDSDAHPDRFRANLVVDLPETEGFVENDWSGRALRIGDCTLDILSPTPRCVMVTLPQNHLPEDKSLLRGLAKTNRVDIPGGGIFTCLGAYGLVREPGTVRTGDPVQIL